MKWGQIPFVSQLPMGDQALRSGRLGMGHGRRHLVEKWPLALEAGEGTEGLSQGTALPPHKAGKEVRKGEVFYSWGQEGETPNCVWLQL